MVVAEVQFYDVIVWLHVSSVVVGFGPTFAFGLYLALARSKYPRSMPAILDAQCTISRTMVTIAALVILASGIYLAADRWEFSDFFVIAGLVAIVILMGMVHGFFVPNEVRAREVAERDIEAAGPGEVKFSDEFERRMRGSAIAGPIAGLIVILTIYFMTTKPFL
jgi:ABC-type amino acid transport system permease subunit